MVVDANELWFSCKLVTDGERPLVGGDDERYPSSSSSSSLVVASLTLGCVGVVGVIRVLPLTELSITTH